MKKVVIGGFVRVLRVLLKVYGAYGQIGVNVGVVASLIDFVLVKNH